MPGSVGRKRRICNVLQHDVAQQGEVARDARRESRAGTVLCRDERQGKEGEGALLPSEKSTLGEAEDLIAGNDEVIEDPHLD